MNINDVKNNSSQFLSELISGNIAYCNTHFINLFDDIAKNLQDTKNSLSLDVFNFTNYEKITKILFYLKGYNVSTFPK